MGILGNLTGWNQYNAAGNAILANHVLPYLDERNKHEIICFIAKSFRTNIFDVTEYLNLSNRVEQLNFVAAACGNIGIEPILKDGIGWRFMKNPKDAGFVKQDDIDYAIKDVERKTRTKVNWPGNDERIDFTAWYRMP